MAQVIAGDALAPPLGTPHQLVFLDPPYGQDYVPRALAALAARGWLGPKAVVLAELGPGDVWAPAVVLAERSHGPARLVFGTFALALPAGPVVLKEFMLSPTIRRLSALTVNAASAAGEVIERPAAAVKELVENALDAKARRASKVILVGGGIARTEVIDDGCGIAQDQLSLAIERHATSKLADDTLVQIATLGFRGEALPSIGAAARLTLISRPAGQDSAYRLSVVGGAVSAVMPAAGPVGTRAIVEDLFFATPARRKFLRSPRAEAEAAERAVWRLALAAPHVAFRVGPRTSGCCSTCRRKMRQRGWPPCSGAMPPG